jgi:DNA-binding IclR family transcriptional regulator
MTADTEVDQKSLVNSVIKACQIIETFTQDRPALTLGELAEANGLNKTTTHRLLASLVRAGWLARGPDGAYKISMRLFTVGSVALTGFDLRDEARPFLIDLARRFGDTAYLMTPSDGGAVCIDLVEGDSALTIKKISIGSVLPYHAAAAPMLMLALSARLQDRWLAHPLERFTPDTITNPDRLRTELARIAETGYTVSDQDYLDGVAAVAAPVRDNTEALTATISLGGPAHHFRGSRLVESIDAVRTAAADLSGHLGSATGPRPTR